ncbi:EAL domain-containing protein [Kosakonia cowanii]
MFINLIDNSERRKGVIAALKNHDENRDIVLNEFVRLTSDILGVSRSFIAIIDDSYQVIRASHNFDLCQTAREDAFCSYVVDSGKVMVVLDTLREQRFAKHPLVVSSPGIRFYAGAPLINREGMVLGTLCVADTVPHSFSRNKIKRLEMLAGLVMAFLDIWHSAGFIDFPTGLPNRHHLIHYLGTLKDDQDTMLRLTLIDCVDIPRTYELARAMGMAPVEALLRDTGLLLREKLSLIPKEIIYAVDVGRYAILASANDRFTAQYVASMLRDLSVHPKNGVAMNLTAHIGEVCFAPSSLQPQESLRRAVSALHDAISRNVPAQEFDELSDTRRNSDFSLMNELSTALRCDSGGLYLVYQPKVSLTSGKTVSLEALIRWRHPVRGELSPAEFLPVVQFTSLMHRLTDWVIDEVLRQLIVWSSSLPSLPVSVNVSISDLSRKDFATTLSDKMKNAGLEPRLIGLECLENEIITENPEALANMSVLRDLGFCILLDDFGAGYSNIGCLQRMPADIIKLDKSLVAGLQHDSGSRIIAQSIIFMLKKLQYVVVAEGVEDEKTLELLREYGCDEAQGYYFSRPLPPAMLEAWCKKKSYPSIL